MTNGEKVKNLRASLKMSRARFSEKYGIPARTIDDWENERRVPANYLVDLLARRVASENIIPTAWVFTEYRDARAYGEDEIFADKCEAIDAAWTHWDRLSEHDRKDYFEGEAWFYVGLFRMEWDENLEKFEPEGDPLVVAWDALK